MENRVEIFSALVAAGANMYSKGTVRIYLFITSRVCWPITLIIVYELLDVNGSPVTTNPVYPRPISPHPHSLPLPPSPRLCL